MDLPVNFNFWILQSLAMGLTVLFLPNLKLTSLFGATFMVIALALVNSHLWDAALFFSIPNSLSTQALLLIVSNGLIFWILVKLLPGIEIKGILPAIAAPVIFTVTSVILNQYASDLDFIKLGKEGIAQIEAARSYFTAQSDKPEKNSDAAAGETVRSDKIAANGER